MNPDGGSIFVVGVLVGAMIVALSGVILFGQFKKEAVEAGAAEWIVDTAGNVEFVWKEKEKQ